MKSTVLADVFYTLGINPFYVIAPLVFLVPIISFVVFYLFIDGSFLYSVGGTTVVFILCCIVFYLYFHRNPERAVTLDHNAVLSPADGMVVYVKKIKQGEVVESVKKKNHMKLTELLDVTNEQVQNVSGFIIGIELRLFDVHLTRAPISGVKVLDHHVTGRIVSMNNPKFECINDRETVVIKENNSTSLHVAVVQIATFLTRTVQSFVRNKTNIMQGEPLGFIRLGSQVDVVLFTQQVNILVGKGDRVYGGVSKIAEKNKL